MSDQTLPDSVAGTLARVDEAWAGFQRRAREFPVEQLDVPISPGWTRKQMLAHIAAWHDITSERLATLMRTGELPPPGEDDDVVNSRVARAAEGRTAGEIFDALDASFRRLRRQISYLNDEALAAPDSRTAAVIAGNTYGHYDEHLADLAAG